MASKPVKAGWGAPAILQVPRLCEAWAVKKVRWRSISFLGEEGSEFLGARELGPRLEECSVTIRLSS